MTKLLSALALVFCVTSVYADTFYVAPTSGDSIDDSLKTSINELISSSLIDKGHRTTKDREQADFEIDSQGIRVGSSVIVVLRKISAGKTLYSDRMKAQTVDEMDTVVARLVEAALSDQAVESTIKIGAISDSEMTEVERRTKTRRFSVSGIGPFKFANLKTDLVGYHLAFGDIREVTPQAAIRTMFEGSFRTHNIGGSDSESAYLASFNIGGIYYFKSTRTSPYLSGSFGYGGAYSSGTESSWGLTVGAELGVAWFRTASSQLQLGLKYMMLASENQEGNPQTIGLCLSILQ